MLLVPGALIALIGAHLYLVVKLGTTAPPWTKIGKPAVAEPTSDLDAGVSGNGYHPNGAGATIAGVQVDGSNGEGAPA
jgi:quinol-cytochrome oxidoreductase complex cytochrome b subunit